jgi:hypothetical protein
MALTSGPNVLEIEGRNRGAAGWAEPKRRMGRRGLREKLG